MYEVQIVAGPEQIRFSRKEEALAQARLLAKQVAVDAWCREGDTIMLTARFRPRS
jgi:hypothetical protein